MNDYWGRTDRGMKGPRSGSSELIAMSLQELAMDPAGFAESDPEAFDWIIDLLMAGRNSP